MKQVISAVLLCTIIALQPSITESREIDPLHIKRNLVDDNVPEGVVFRSYVSEVSLLYSEDTKRAVHYVQDSLGLSHDEAGHQIAERITPVLARSGSDLKRGQQRAEYQVLCTKQNLSDEEAFRALASLDEVRLSIYQKHYALLRAELGVDDLDHILNYVAERKIGYSYVEFEHKRAYADLGINVTETVMEICNNLMAQGASR